MQSAADGWATGERQFERTRERRQPHRFVLHRHRVSAARNRVEHESHLRARKHGVPLLKPAPALTPITASS